MLFEFKPAEAYRYSKSSHNLRAVCRRARCLEDIVLKWVQEERFFTTVKRLDEVSGKPFIYIMFYENSEFVGIAKAAFEQLCRVDPILSPLNQTLLQQSEVPVEFTSGRYWFKKNEFA